MMSSHESPVVFECRGDQLVGILHSSSSNTKETGVIVVVGGPQYRVGSHRQFTLFARALSEAGYAVLRFDYRGMGDSEGNSRSFENVGDDIAAAIDVMQRERAEVKRIALFGLCDAASACLMYSQRGDVRVNGVILANPWVRTTSSEATSYLKHYYLRRLLQRSFWAKIGSGAFSLRRSFGDLIQTIKRARQPSAVVAKAESAHYVDRMLGGLRSRQWPVLLIMSGRDLTAREFEDLCGRDKDWQQQIQRDGVDQIRSPGADHTFSSREDLEWVNTQCKRWLDKLAVR